MTTDTTSADQLRDLVTQAVADALKPRYAGPQHNSPGGLPLTATAEEIRSHRAQPLADAVLAALPAPALAVARQILGTKTVELEIAPNPDSLERAIVRARRILGGAEQADTVAAPVVDRATVLREAIARVRVIPVQCTALTGPTWFGQGWEDAIREFEEIAEHAAAEAQQPTPAPAEETK